MSDRDPLKLNNSMSARKANSIEKAGRTSSNAPVVGQSVGADQDFPLENVGPDNESPLVMIPDELDPELQIDFGDADALSRNLSIESSVFESFPGLQISSNANSIDDGRESELSTDEVVCIDDRSVPANGSQALDMQARAARVLPASRRRFFTLAMPSWLVSFLVHVAILVILAAVHVEPIQKVLNVLTASTGNDSSEGLQDFDLQANSVEAPESSESITMPSPIDSQASLVELAELPISEFGQLPIDQSVKNVVEQVVPSSALNTTASQMLASLNSRSKTSRGTMLERFGGNAASEKAVAMGLKWLAEHQTRSGAWTFAHSLVCRGQCKDPGVFATATNSATAMALLPFLGAGQTHVEGEYQETVKKGLAFLIRSMKVTSGPTPQGSWWEDRATMYAHGLAAITVCEAYAMTHDPDLLQPAQLAINYIVESQDPRGGGWRYAPKQPGDTSVVGWQLMALKSGTMGNLVVPQKTLRLTSSFLDSVSMNSGTYYGYDRPTTRIEGRTATTAVGLLCRMYLGTPKTDPGIIGGVKVLSSRGPRIEDLYYSYYATQVLRHYGGPEWDKWNNILRDQLVKAQVQEGHAAGSWLTHVPGRGGHQEKGGRLYCTSLATMILEVYYRHMPLYSEKSSADDFEL